MKPKQPLDNLLPPMHLALGSIVMTPLVGLCVIMAGILLILAWPFIPIMCYFGRKEALMKCDEDDQQNTETK